MHTFKKRCFVERAADLDRQDGTGRRIGELDDRIDACAFERLGEVAQVELIARLEVGDGIAAAVFAGLRHVFLEPGEGIAAAAAGECIGTAEAAHHIRAGAAVEHIGSLAALEGIVERRPDDLFDAVDLVVALTFDGLLADIDGNSPRRRRKVERVEARAAGILVVAKSGANLILCTPEAVNR